MSVFLESGYFDQTIQKMIETGKGYFINGQYYTKKDLTPLPLVQYPTVGSSTRLSLSKNLVRKELFGLNRSECVVRDNENPDITYTIVDHDVANKINIIKTLENDKETKVLLNNDVNFGAYVKCHEIIGQDKDYVYIVITYNESAYNYCYIGMFRKDNLTLTYHKLSFDAYEGEFRCISEGNNMFLISNYNDYSCVNFYVYDKKNNNDKSDLKRINYDFEDSTLYANEVKKYLSDTNDCHMKISKILEDSKGKYVYSATEDTESHKLVIKKSYIDISKYGKDDKHIITPEIIIPDVSMLNENLLDRMLCSRERNMDFFIKEVDGTQYLNIAYYSVKGEDCLTPAKLKNEGIYTFLLGAETVEVDVPNPEKNETNKDDSSVSETIKENKEVTTAKLVHYEPFEQCIGVMTNNDDSFLIALNKSNVSYYGWNNTSMGYVKNSVLPIIADCISMNEYENIFILEKDTGKVYQNSPTIPSDIILNFEKVNYKYEGEDLKSYLQFEVKNFEGANLEKNITINLIGDAVFSSNGAKQIKETSSIDGKKNIAITINGDGNIFARGQYDG